MKKLHALIIASILTTTISCRDDKKESQQTNTNTETIEIIEKELEETNKTLKNKASEVEKALSELDN